MLIFVRTSSSECASRNCPIEHFLAEDKLGTMLPCNVVLQQQEDGRIEVSAVDPVASMQAITHVVVGQVAQDIRSDLERVIDEVGNSD